MRKFLCYAALAVLIAGCATPPNIPITKNSMEGINKIELAFSAPSEPFAINRHTN